MAVVFEKAYLEKLKTHSNPTEQQFLKATWADFKTQGLPSVKEPIWHYVPLTHFELDQFAFNTISKPALKTFEQAHIQKIPSLPDSFSLVFYNGVVLPHLSNLPPKAVHFMPTSDQAKKHAQPFKLFNQIFCDKICQIQIQQNMALSLIYINNSTKPIFSNQICQIQVHPKAHLTLLEHTCNLSDTPCLQSLQTEIHLLEKAHLTYASFQRNHPESLILQDLSIQQDQNTQGQYFLCPLSGKLNHLQCHIKLQGEQSQSFVHGLHQGKGHQLINTHLTVEHLAPHTESQHFFRGVLSDASKGACTGDIHITPKAQHAKTHFESKNILRSKHAQAYVRPQLSVDQDQLENCTHGATIGHLDPEALFYLQSRGIPQQAAEQLLLAAFLDPIVTPLQKTVFKSFLNEA